MTFRQRLRQTAGRIDALSLRERGMLLVGAFMVLFLIWDWLLMADVTQRSKAVNGEIALIQARMSQLNETITAAAQNRSIDPNAVLQEELTLVGQETAALDEQLAARSGNVVPPQEMARVLKEMLGRHGRLKLVGVRNLERKTLFDKTADTAEAETAELPGSVYRHGLELELDGRYLDVLAYLRELEQLPWRFFWEAVDLESTDYPVNRVRIVVYTLNFEKGWLGV